MSTRLISTCPIATGPFRFDTTENGLATVWPGIPASGLSFALTQSEAEKFWGCVERGDGCWLWQASLDAYGYGRFGMRGKRYKAHRIAWIVAYGPLPPGPHVLHRCDTRNCVRPEHLFLGSHLDNVRDMLKKGRQARGTACGVYAKPGSRCHGERNGSAKLSDADVEDIRKRRLVDGVSARELAAEYHVHPTSIPRIVSGRSRGGPK